MIDETTQFVRLLGRVHAVALATVFEYMNACEYKDNQLD